VELTVLANLVGRATLDKSTLLSHPLSVLIPTPPTTNSSLRSPVPTLAASTASTASTHQVQITLRLALWISLTISDLHLLALVLAASACAYCRSSSSPASLSRPLKLVPACIRRNKLDAPAPSRPQSRRFSPSLSLLATQVFTCFCLPEALALLSSTLCPGSGRSAPYVTHTAVNTLPLCHGSKDSSW